MSDTQELETTQGAVDNGTSTGEAKATGTGEQVRQPKVNLTELQEFKKWQSAADARDAYNQRIANEAQQRAYQAEQMTHQMRMQGMDREGQLEYQNQLLQQSLAEVQRQRELDQYAMTRQRDLEEISEETGVPFEDIAGLPNVHDAWRVGNKYMKENGKPSKGATSRGAPKDDELETDDRVDVATSLKPTSPSKAYQDKYDAARNGYNVKEMWQAEDAANRAGVDIRIW